MNWLLERFAELNTFFDAGGEVLWLIALVMLVLWTLVIERYWFIYRVYPDKLQAWTEQWQARADRSSWYAQRIRQAMISQAELSLRQGMPAIRTLVAASPLLGLLGTVTGMIHVFDVMAVLGTGNARAMASGISRATIPTMAGMVTALPGLYFVSQLEHRMGQETERLADSLRHESLARQPGMGITE